MKKKRTKTAEANIARPLYTLERQKLEYGGQYADSGGGGVGRETEQQRDLAFVNMAASPPDDGASPHTSPPSPLTTMYKPSAQPGTVHSRTSSLHPGSPSPSDTHQLQYGMHSFSQLHA